MRLIGISNVTVKSALNRSIVQRCEVPFDYVLRQLIGLFAGILRCRSMKAPRQCVALETALARTLARQHHGVVGRVCAGARARNLALGWRY